MPVYEFLCPDCTTILSFFSRSVKTDVVPRCPRCNKQNLSRQISRFAITGKSKSGDGDDELDSLGLDESAMEKAMGALASKAEKINEDDPRQAAQLMKEFSRATGLKYNDTMEDALSRMEAGEDPEAIEESLGDSMDSDELPFVAPGKKGQRVVAVQRDDTLYDMEEYY